MPCHEQLPPLPPLVSPGATSTSGGAIQNTSVTTTSAATSATSSSMTTSETTTAASSTTNSSMTTSETTTQVETSTSSTADETANETTTPQASSTTSSSMTTSETATPVATTTSQVATTTTTTSTAEPPTSAPTKSAATTTTSTISTATAENTTVAATTTTSTTGQSTTEVWGAWTKGGDDVEDKVTENVTEGPNATDVASEAGEAVKAAGAAAKAIWDGLTGSGNASEVANSTAAAAEAVKEAAKTAAQAIFGPSGPKTKVQVTIEANSVPEEEYLTTGVQDIFRVGIFGSTELPGSQQHFTLLWLLAITEYFMVPDSLTVIFSFSHVWVRQGDVALFAAAVRFHQATSAALCAAIGHKLGSEVGGRCILLTGGNAIVHEAVARPFFEEVGRDRSVFHLCPLGRVCHFDFGVIVGAGSDSTERREIFARSCSACIAVEGGPGTMDEMKLALTNGVPVLAVKKSGGASEEIYHTFPDGLPKPRGVDKTLWDRLTEESGTPEETAEVVVKLGLAPEVQQFELPGKFKYRTLKATMQTLAEELDAEAGHADADTELKLRVMAMDAVRQSRGLLDGTMLRLVAFNCSAPGLRSFELSTGVDLQKALHEVTTTVDGVCVLKGSPKAADVAAQKVLDTALLQAVARQHAAALSETNKAVRGAHTALKQLQSEALQMQPNSTLLRAVKEVLESHRNSSESLAKAIEKVNATMAPKAKIIRTQMRMKLLERLRVYRNLALFGLQGTLEAGARFAGGLRKVLPVPSLGAWAVQLGEAELGVNRTLEAYNSFRAAAAAAEDAKVEAETVKVESEKASEAASEYEAVAQNRSLEAQKMRDEMNVPGAVVNTTEIDILDGEAKVAADAAGSQKREDEQLQLLYQQLLQEIAGNLSQEVALAKTVEGSLEAVVGASMVADLQSAGAAEFAKTSLRHMNASKHRPVSLLDIQGAGEAGNVTVRVDIFSQNASEIHEVIEALERRLKATFISDFAAAIRWRSQEYATAGHLRMSALVGSLDSAVIGDVANTTAETIHDVLGNVVTDIQKVQIAGLPNVSGEGLPIHAPSPADEAKAPSTGRPPTEEAEEAEASSLSTPQAHGSVRGPWSFVGLVGIAVLGVLGLLLVIILNLHSALPDRGWRYALQPLLRSSV
eukprot:s1158_g7.t5